MPARLLFCVLSPLALLLVAGGSCDLVATEVKGTVVDPSRAPIAGAQVAAINSVGLITEQITDDLGHFDFNVSPLYENVQLRITAAGFQTLTTAEGASAIQLAIAPRTESIRVAGSAIDIPANQTGTSISTVTGGEIRERNEPQVLDVMRELPGMVFAQSGARGSLAGLFVRGGDTRYNLVLLDGIPLNSFYFGGLFDFSQIPSDPISEIDVARGPQSAIYGSYAIGSVVSLVTRSPSDGPALDLLTEGGAHEENRFAASGSMLTHGWGVAGSASSLLANGPVQNSDVRNDSVFLSLEHRWFSQGLFAFGAFDSNEVGEPGPWGSDPRGYFTGIDLISREKNNTSTYGVHYQDDFTDKLRLDVIAGFFLNNSLYLSPYGTSFNKDLRPYGDLRGTWRPLSLWTVAAGFTYSREELKNTYVAASNGYNFPFRRDDEGIYLDNQLVFLRKLFVNAGLREELYEQPFTPGDAFTSPPRPDFSARTDSRLNPKISAAYILSPDLRIHGSFGTGLRPPGGADLAFTNNPALKPERTEAYDIGVEERLLNGRLALDATWFRNRYRDLIVSLGGSLANLSSYATGNLSNALARGVDVSAKYRPTNWWSLSANYLWLESEVLSLNGSAGLVQQYFYAGQPLPRRPKQSGSAVATVHHGRFDVDAVAYLRGRDLDVEPNFGASAGFFEVPGYVNLGLNVNFLVRRNLTAYANLHNALNHRYEEVLGYPAPLLNVVAGLKWSLARAR